MGLLRVKEVDCKYVHRCTCADYKYRKTEKIEILKSYGFI